MVHEFLYQHVHLGTIFQAQMITDDTSVQAIPVWQFSPRPPRAAIDVLAERSFEVKREPFLYIYVYIYVYYIDMYIYI